MSLHADAVKVLAGWTPPDDEQQTLRDLYLVHLRAHSDGLSRDCRPGHITASTAVLDAARRRVLLTLHRKIGRWLQLGGHCEPGDATLAAVALREATEESGIAHLALLAGPVNLDRHAVPCGLAARQAGPPPAGSAPAARWRPRGGARSAPASAPVVAGQADPGRTAAGAAAPAPPGGSAPGAAAPGAPGATAPGPGEPETAGPAGWTWHLDVQFVAISPAGARPFRGDESDDLRWWPVGSLPSSADEAVRRLVTRACAFSL